MEVSLFLTNNMPLWECLSSVAISKLLFLASFTGMQMSWLMYAMKFLCLHIAFMEKIVFFQSAMVFSKQGSGIFILMWLKMYCIFRCNLPHWLFQLWQWSVMYSCILAVWWTCWLQQWNWWAPVYVLLSGYIAYIFSSLQRLPKEVEYSMVP